MSSLCLAVAHDAQSDHGDHPLLPGHRHLQDILYPRLHRYKVRFWNKNENLLAKQIQKKTNNTNTVLGKDTFYADTKFHHTAIFTIF